MLYALRHSFKFYGKTLRVTAFKPVHDLNEAILVRFRQNVSRLAAKYCAIWASATLLICCSR